ncbi:MAG TPA: hypothetical protein VFQ65_05610 [Kofleriaceae bacterium]|nr:hypothetical protein [Kofleriaceae bacterium]
MVEVEAPCSACGTRTKHRGDSAGALRCVRCVLEASLPVTSDVTPMVTPAVPLADEPKQRSKAEIIAAIVSIAILGFLVYAFIRGA